MTPSPPDPTPTPDAGSDGGGKPRFGEDSRIRAEEAVSHWDGDEIGGLIKLLSEYLGIPVNELAITAREIVDAEAREYAGLPPAPSPARPSASAEAAAGQIRDPKCRLCDNPAVATFHFPDGCVCCPDTIQHLCMHHAIRATPIGSVDLIAVQVIDGPGRAELIGRFGPIPDTFGLGAERPSAPAEAQADDAGGLKPEWLHRLVNSVLHNLQRVSVCGDPASHARWWVASEVFGLGSTSAKKLCEDFGLDPDEKVGGFENP